MILHQKTDSGEVDSFNRPVLTDGTVEVYNVLVGEPSTQEIIDTQNLYGKKLAYTLAIPKGDTHIWTDTEVEFFGVRYRTIGKPTRGIDDNIPLEWNQKVKVEACV